MLTGVHRVHFTEYGHRVHFTEYGRSPETNGAKQDCRRAASLRAGQEGSGHTWMAVHWPHASPP